MAIDLLHRFRPDHVCADQQLYIDLHGYVDNIKNAAVALMNLYTGTSPVTTIEDVQQDDRFCTGARFVKVI